MNQIEIGRLLRAGTTGFVAGCRVNQLDAPSFGALVRAPLGSEYQIFGIIYDIRIDDDGLVRQLVTADNVSDEVMKDNRERRIVPVEMSVLAVGYEQEKKIHHLLPPRPPLSLDVIFMCDNNDIARFTEKFGYFRHILNNQEIPVGEVVAAHLLQASVARGKESGTLRQNSGQAWKEAATHEVITLLRDDYPALMSVLGALSDVA
ncbi:MAG: hypothetical protein HKUEN02_18950 [Anaerolineaceae bacterium]|nr:MAG: hypothetical protein HKUEN02_18950 [Anaerolineaceae bacterium]